MAALRYFHGLRFALDPASVPPCLRLSHSSLTITYQGEDPSSPPPHSHGGGSASSDPGFTLPEACADVIIGRGQYYWEVEVCNSSVYRIVYDTTQEPLCSVPPQIKTIGVFLNIGGGILSFHNPLTQEHLATLPTLFHPAGVRPALCLGQGRIRLRSGLPPPSHVFLCRNSNYRGPYTPCCFRLSLCNVECEEWVGLGAAGFLDLSCVLVVRQRGSCIGPAPVCGHNPGYVHLLCRNNIEVTGGGGPRCEYSHTRRVDTEQQGQPRDSKPLQRGQQRAGEQRERKKEGENSMNELKTAGDDPPEKK
ncbi:unnamed protein product [Tetraodon nigroviridis]|uniref:(spotted green pufferfish) hypothetical protein n=1 Tax=Tetraodon nigroviridis TaxID=99883 RepID=Q4RZ02_TETNG|nr:unnamed protein product [Tetraodon nigroviridis]